MKKKDDETPNQKYFVRCQAQAQFTIGDRENNARGAGRIRAQPYLNGKAEDSGICPGG